MADSMNDEKEKVAAREKRSSYCYPTRTLADEYIKAVEEINDVGLRKLIKLILLCGWRFGEVINSYLFYDADGRAIIRGLNLKNRKGFKIIQKAGDLSYFLGAKRLNMLKRQDIWKSVELQNVFNIDTEEIQNLINDEDNDRVKYVAEHIGITTYKDAYRRLQTHAKVIKIKYKRNEAETDIMMFYRPAFHFYRKLFAAQYNYVNNYNLMKTITFMRWKNLNVITKYVKDY